MNIMESISNAHQQHVNNVTLVFKFNTQLSSSVLQVFLLQYIF